MLKHIITRALPDSRNDGRILCGSTLEMNDFDKHTTDAVHDELQATAYR